MHTIIIDGIEYHAEQKTIWDEGKLVEAIVPIFDENHEHMIPSHVCICAAMSAEECCCLAWDRMYD